MPTYALTTPSQHPVIRLVNSAGEPALDQVASVSAGYRSGQYYGPMGAATSTRSFANGDMRLIPYLVRGTQTFDRIGIEVTTAGSAGTVFRLGIFKHNAVNGTPGDLIVDAGTVPGDATGAQAAIISQSLTLGWYWLAVAGQSLAGSPALRGFTGPIAGSALDLTISSGTTMNITNNYVHTGVTGAFSNLTATPTASNTAPCIVLRAA